MYSASHSGVRHSPKAQLARANRMEGYMQHSFPFQVILPGDHVSHRQPGAQVLDYSNDVAQFHCISAHIF